jgi:hypothetical protein
VGLAGSVVGGIIANLIGTGDIMELKERKSSPLPAYTTTPTASHTP